MIGLALTPRFVPTAGWWPAGARYAADFVNRRYMKSGTHAAAPDAFTFSRGSEALGQTLDGTWRLFGSGVPAATNAGLTCEPAQTFYAVNANMTDAALGVAGSGGALPTGWSVLVSGGLSVEVTATGTHGDAPFVRLRISGTSTGTDFQLAFNAETETASAGETWTAGFFLRRSGGSSAGLEPSVRVVEEDEGVYIAASTVAIPWSDDFVRSTVSREIESGSASNVRSRMRLSLPLVGAVVDVSVDILLPALVKDTVLRTPMLTGAAGTTARAADAVTLLFPASVASAMVRLSNGSDHLLDGPGPSRAIPTDLDLPCTIALGW